MSIRCTFLISSVLTVFVTGLMAQTNTFPSSGNVGIGTTSPGAKLDVNGNLLLSGGRSVLFTTGDNTTTQRGGIQFLTYNNGLTNVWTPTDQNGNPINSAVRFGGFSNFNSNVVDVLVSGIMGVGALPTDSTTLRLQRASGASGDGNLVFGDGSKWTRLNSNTSGAVYNPLVQAGDHTYLYDSGALVVAPWSGSPIGIRIDASGNVGIGTATPTQKLSVNGTVRAKEVVVDTGWSDYVFKPDYKLASLREVEGAIKREGHLPGIPSAADVADHGVNMGEMQSKLLAKVEELTLHLIAQEKAIDQLKSQNVSLRSRITELESSRNP